MKDQTELKSKVAVLEEWRSSDSPYVHEDDIYGAMEEYAAQYKDRPTPPVETKTAEEILRETFEKYNNDPNSKLGIIEIEVKAMEAYHAQFTPSAKSVEVEEANATAQDQAIINVDNMPNIHKQLSEKAYIFGFIDGANYQQQKQAETISRLREVIKNMDELIFKSGLHSNPQLSFEFLQKAMSLAKEALKEKVIASQEKDYTLLTESLKTIYSLAKPGSAIYDICDKTLNPPQTDR